MNGATISAESSKAITMAVSGFLNVPRSMRVDEVFRLLLGFVEPGVLLSPLKSSTADMEAERSMRMTRQLRRAGVKLATGRERARHNSISKSNCSKQQQIAAKLLERRVDLQILNRLPPQDRRRNRHLATAQLEEVQDEQRRHRDRGGEGGDQD